MLKVAIFMGWRLYAAATPQFRNRQQAEQSAKRGGWRAASEESWSMQRLFKPVRTGVRPGAARIRRTQAAVRGRTVDRVSRSAPQQDLSGLIFYGQA
jgi:hypothetical protein